eukprot:Skav228173  [mRNA]  locus=scaffold3933:11455:12267:- [translate_table: standard]
MLMKNGDVFYLNLSHPDKPKRSLSIKVPLIEGSATIMCYFDAQTSGDTLFQSLAETFGIDVSEIKLTWAGSASVVEKWDRLWSYFADDNSNLVMEVKSLGGAKGVKQAKAKAKKVENLKKALCGQSGWVAIAGDDCHSIVLNKLNHFGKKVQQNAVEAIREQTSSLSLSELDVLHQKFENHKDITNVDAKVKDISSAFFGESVKRLEDKIETYKNTLALTKTLMLFAYTSAGAESEFKISHFSKIVDEFRFKKIGAQNAHPPTDAPMPPA